MIFNSIEFIIFFPIVILAYYTLPEKFKLTWLLICSYYFYMCWNARYAILIFFSTIITYVSGLMLETVKTLHKSKKKEKNYKNIIVAFSFISNLSVLFYYKYFDFTLEMIIKIGSAFDICLNAPVFDIILPVGISFYTFQALSYTMDVYRNDIYAEKNFFKYALFVSFFPQLVAGPIERSKNLLNQLSNPIKFSFVKARDGLLLMLWGFFLKIVLADRIALFVDTVYASYEIYTGGYLIIATFLFSVQIYCDFYGYSVIAMGAAEILGIQLMENFYAPYFSTSVSDFWRNWHISLTSWFKDYLYIPLGGNKKGKLRKYVNKMIVFLVSGLWHGAEMSFVIWGGVNGLYQIVGEILQPVRNFIVDLFQINKNSKGHNLLRIVGTFFLIDFSWIFFRAKNVKEAFAIILKIVTIKNPWIWFDGSLYTCGLDSKNFGLMLICIGILFLADYCKYKNIVIRKIIVRQDYWFRWLIIVFSICSILVFGIWGPGYDESNFIYFQF